MDGRVLVRNPASGDRRRSRTAAALARERGYEVRDSTGPGGTHTLAREAADAGASLVAACGGDGTLNEVVRGVDDAGRLGEVTLGVVPAGTGNDFADNVGVRGVTHAFDVLDRGETRRLDVGEAGGDGEPPRPFLNSCIGGLTAEASVETTPAMKRRFGTLAYAIATLRRTRGYPGLDLTLRAASGGDPLWSGTAAMLLIGNGRRFPGEGRGRANVEDGRLNVVVVERAPAVDYLARGAADRLFGRDGSRVRRLSVPTLTVESSKPCRFSLDGEPVDRRRLDVRVRHRAMPFKVGEGYDPNPTNGPSGSA